MIHFLIKNIFVSFVFCVLSFSIIATGHDPENVKIVSSEKENNNTLQKIIYKQLEKFKKSLEYSINQRQKEYFLLYLSSLPYEIKIDSQEFNEALNDLVLNLTEENYYDIFIHAIINNVKKKLSYTMNEKQERELNRLFLTIKIKEITFKQSLLDIFLVIEESSFVGFCVKANHFYQNLASVGQSTAILTKMLYNKTDFIDDFIDRNFGEIAYFASHHLIQCFSFLFAKKGLPHKEEVQNLDMWPEWKINGQFKMDLLKSFANMYYSRGIPKQKDIKKILDWPQWRTNGQFDLILFKSFAAHYQRRGLPQMSDVEKFLLEYKFNCEPTIESITKHRKDELDERQKKELSLLFQKLQDKKIKIQQTFCNLLIYARNEVFYDLCKNLLVFFQNSSYLIDNTTNLTSILTERHSHIQDFAERDCEEIAYIAALNTYPCFASIYKRKFFPKREDIDDILSWSYWNTNDRKFNQPLFTSFSFFHRGKGLPKKSDVDKFLLMKDKHVYLEPTLEDIKTNLSYTLNTIQSDNLSLLLTKLKDKEILIKKTFYDTLLIIPKKQFNDFCKNICCFFDNLLLNVVDTSIVTGMINKKKKYIVEFAEKSSEEIAYLASHHLLSYFSAMYTSYGFPKQQDIKEICDWPQWKKEDDSFNMELFISFCNFHRAQGCPTMSHLESFLLQSQAHSSMKCNALRFSKSLSSFL